MPNANRDKGHRYERELADRWRDLGFPECRTSRYTSRELDDKGVDLANTDPFLVQAKAYKSAPPLHRLLDDLDTKFEGQGKYPVVYWKRPIAGKRKHQELVAMKAEDFEELILKLKHGGML